MISRTARETSWLFLPAIVGVVFSIILVVQAHRTNGVDCFPLDDPWIHLTYARNLALHHSFSYFPGDPVTGGSTSPLYTLLLSAGSLLTWNEKVLSYALGILFHAAFLVVAALWARKRLSDLRWAAVFALVLALDPRVAILSVSGMETSLFLFLLAAAFWSWASARWISLGVALGLGVWTRPEMLMLAVIFLVVGLMRRGTTDPIPSRRWLIPFGALVLLYFAFNQLTSGALMPGTFAAKHAYYNSSPLYFITHGLREAVLDSGFWILTPLAFFAVCVEVIRFVRGRGGVRPPESAWAIALPLAYIVYVPFAHRFSRYLVPAFPAIALLGLATLRELKVHRLVPVVVVAGVLIAQGARVPYAIAEYGKLCAYHYQRHERCGRWLKENTPATAVIATHDVGAIAYYSERRIIDMVGLIQPDAVPHLHQPDYTTFLADFFTRENVTHLAVLETWMPVANQDALWLAHKEPELLRVYEWIPGRTLLVPEEARALNLEAVALMKKGDATRAEQLLQQSLKISPENSRTWGLLGDLYAAAGNIEAARYAYSTAIRLYPEFDKARVSLEHLNE